MPPGRTCPRWKKTRRLSPKMRQKTRCITGRGEAPAPHHLSISRARVSMPFSKQHRQSPPIGWRAVRHCWTLYDSVEQVKQCCWTRRRGIKRYCHSRCGIRKYRHYGQYLPEKRPRLFSPTNVYVDALTERANLFAEFSCQSNC